MKQFFSILTRTLEVPVNIKNMMIAGAFLVAAVILFNCGGGGPTNPPDGCEPNCSNGTEITLTMPLDGLAIAENDTIFCEQPSIKPQPTGLKPDWWLRGDGSWIEARGDSIRMACVPLGGLGSPMALIFVGSGSLAQPPAAAYTVATHARVLGTNPGPIAASDSVHINIASRQN